MPLPGGLLTAAPRAPGTSWAVVQVLRPPGPFLRKDEAFRTQTLFTFLFGSPLFLPVTR